jgi:hypothetical protein
MGRVTLWIKDHENPEGRTQVVKFSSHGSYLKRPGERFLSFDEKGIALLAPDRAVLWWKDIKQIAWAKDGGESLIAQHQKEMKAQDGAETRV